MGRAYAVRKASIEKTGAARGKLYTTFAKEIYLACKHGVPEIESNLELRRLVEKAKKQQVPNDIIDRAIAKAKGENSFTGIQAKMNEMKYEKAILNKYDIETSATIQQAADASFKAIFNQLSLSEAEVYKTCQDQLKKLVELQRENLTL